MTQSCPPPPPIIDLNPSISAHTGEAIQRAMALERDARWQNAHTLKDAITTKPTAKKPPHDGNATQVIPQPKPASSKPGALKTAGSGSGGLNKIGSPQHGIPMVLIPAGSFLMGSEEGLDEEKPVHEVWLDDYYIDVYPVTNKEYIKFLQASGYLWEQYDERIVLDPKNWTDS